MRRSIFFTTVSMSLAVAACPSEEEELDLPPRVEDDDDVSDDDDAVPNFLECGAPDAAQAYISPFALELATLVPDPDARALGWAVDVSEYAFHGLLSDAFEITLFAFADEGCPSREVTTADLDPDPRCTESTRNSRAQSTWEGGCVGTCDFEIVGEAAFALRRLECSTAEGLVREREKTATAAAFEVGALVRHLGGVTRFGLDGTMRHLHRETTGAAGVAVHEEWDVQAGFIAIPGPPKGFLSDLWRLGTGDATLTGSADAIYVDGVASGVRGHVSGTASTGGILPPWGAEFDVTWDDAVCALEPVRGTVTGRRLDALPPEGQPITWASVVYDGATACDGCGTVYSGELASGELCRGPSPSAPSLD